jgi:hypothetical protein
MCSVLICPHNLARQKVDKKKNILNLNIKASLIPQNLLKKVDVRLSLESTCIKMGWLPNL